MGCHHGNNILPQKGLTSGCRWSVQGRIPKYGPLLGAQGAGFEDAKGGPHFDNPLAISVQIRTSGPGTNVAGTGYSWARFNMPPEPSCSGEEDIDLTELQSVRGCNMWMHHGNPGLSRTPGWFSSRASPFFSQASLEGNTLVGRVYYSGVMSH